jgi:hypothetical protein
MPLPVALRTRTTTDTSGTGTVTLNASAADARSLFAAFGAAAQVGYIIDFPSSSQWEIGLGAYNGANPGTLTRPAANVIAGSAGAGVNVAFSAGRKDVFLWVAPDQREVTSFSGTSTAALADLGGILAFTGSANATLNLPAAATVPRGSGYLVKHEGSAGAILTLDGNASELVGTATTLPICEGEEIRLWSTGTAWRVSGLPPLARIRTQTLSGTPSVLDFALPIPGVLYELRWDYITTSADTQLVMRTSTDGGATFAAGGSDYVFSFNFVTAAATASPDTGASGSITLSGTADNASGNSGIMEFMPGAVGQSFRVLRGQSTYFNAAAAVLQGGTFNGTRVATGAQNAIRLLPGTGTFTAGGIVTLSMRR